MRRGSKYALTAVVTVAVGAVVFFAWPHSIEDVSAARAKLGPNSVARGEYLARAADCVACHTLGNGKPYAGGLPFHLPFGTIYASNITADKDTGIGQWSDGEFVRALRHGVGRDSKDLYPAFPYTSYASMTTEDALSIKDYLFSLEPVRSETPANSLSFPFDQRYLMRGWKLLFLSRQQFPDGESADAKSRRGEYLVDVLGHCGECHTPRNQLFALDQGRKFSGAVTAGWKAYNISSDKEEGIGGWTSQQIADYLSKGHAEGRGAASGSMAEAVEFSLRYLSKDDLSAMVTYLQATPPQRGSGEGVVANDPPMVRRSGPATPPPDETGSPASGLAIFQSACASCHAWNGQGVQHPHATLVGAQTVNDPSGMNLLQVLIKGSHLKTNEGDIFMPAFGAAYSDEELAAVANYVVAHFGDKKANITARQVNDARKIR
jgi:mono/diheme cytochrome c family protein